MTRIAHLADLHLTEQRGDSGESLDDQVERLVWIGEDACSNDAKAILIAGDIFDKASTPLERNAAIEVIVNYASKVPVVIVAGNHDRPNELTFLSKLKTECMVWVADRPVTMHLQGLDVACLPWPRKVWLTAEAPDVDDLGKLAAKAMGMILAGFTTHWDVGVHARVLLGHVELYGATLDSGQPMTGKADIELSCDDLLSSGADVACLGHIHAHQLHAAGRVLYAGSPRQCNFGETGPKGYCLINIQHPAEVCIEHREAPGRKLITVEADWIDGELVTEAGALGNCEALPNGSIVRLKYHVEEPDRQQAAEQAERAKARWVEAGAHSTKLDPRVTPVSRMRSEAIREAKTNEDRLRAYWEARGETPSRSESILGKLGEIEAKVGHG